MSNNDNENGRVLRPIKNAWMNYMRTVLPADASSLQQRETRKAFYAGAGALFTLVTGPTYLDHGEEVTEADLKKMDVLAEEISDFKQELDRELLGEKTCNHCNCNNIATKRPVFKLVPASNPDIPAESRVELFVCDEHATEQMAHDLLIGNDEGWAMIEKTFAAQGLEIPDRSLSYAEWEPIPKPDFQA